MADSIIKAPSLPPGVSHAAFGLGALTAAGGVFGYVRSGSPRSLGAGAILGGMFVSNAVEHTCMCSATPDTILQAFAGYKISQGEAEKGFKLAALNGLALAIIMGYRFAKTRKVMPAGLLSSVGIGAAAYYGKLYYDFTSD